MGAIVRAPLILNANTVVSNSRISTTLPTGVPELGDIDLNGFILTFVLEIPMRVTGAITRAGVLVKQGPATLVLYDNSYTGLSSITEGLVIAAHVNALGASGAGNETHVAELGSLDVFVDSLDETLRLDGALLQSFQDATTTMAGPILLGGGMAPPVIANSGTLTIAGPITKGTGVTFIKGGPGTVVVSNAANQWDLLVINAGIVRVGAAGALPDAGAVQLGNDGAPSTTLDLNGHDERSAHTWGTRPAASRR